MLGRWQNPETGRWDLRLSLLACKIDRACNHECKLTTYKKVVQELDRVRRVPKDHLKQVVEHRRIEREENRQELAALTGLSIDAVEFIEITVENINETIKSDLRDIWQRLDRLEGVK